MNNNDLKKRSNGKHVGQPTIRWNDQKILPENGTG